MHLNKDSKRIILLIGIGVLIFCLLMLGIFAVLGRFNTSVLWGAIIGSLLAILNFATMAYFLQKAMNTPDRAKLMTQASYTLRTLITILCIILSIVLLKVNPIAVIVPYIFPRLSIYILQVTGLYHSNEPIDEKTQLDTTENAYDD